MKKIIKLGKAAFYLLMLITGFLYGKLLAAINPDYRDVWLISERGTDARDNGYWFFRYMQESHKEKNSYYVIDKSSEDFKKLEQYGHIIQYKSFLHHAMLAVAAIRISTHDMGYTPDMVIYHWLNRFHLIPGKKVLLQHGIMGADIEWYHREQCPVDLFITSARQEYESIIRIFNQPASVVRLTGLCRYDHLTLDKCKKQILIMPTWRQYLVGLTEAEFTKTDYYKNYMALLNDDELTAWLKSHGYSIVFYPHIEMQKFIHSFHSNSQVVRIACFGSDDVQQLLIESELLITDFSSVFFDAAYMGHKILYYQFDKKLYEGNHYKKCLFDYGTFGPVCITKEELMPRIRESILATDDSYHQAKHNFFSFHDQGNCQRVYNEIIRIL